MPASGRVAKHIESVQSVRQQGSQEFSPKGGVLIRTLVTLLIAIGISFLETGMLRGQESDDKGFEIISHRARLRLFPQSIALSCTDTLGVHVTRHDLKKLSLVFFRLFTPRQVLLNGKKKEYKHRGDDLILEDIPSDSLFEVIVSYAGNFSV